MLQGPDGQQSVLPTPRPDAAAVGAWDSDAVDGEHAEQGAAAAAGLGRGSPPGAQLLPGPESSTRQHGRLDWTEQGEASCSQTRMALCVPEYGVRTVETIFRFDCRTSLGMDQTSPSLTLKHPDMD